MSGNRRRFVGKRRLKDEGSQSQWIVTYADMVTLLMVFFVLLFSFSEIDAQRFRTVLMAFQASMGVLDGGVQVIHDDAALAGAGRPRFG